MRKGSPSSLECLRPLQEDGVSFGEEHDAFLLMRIGPSNQGQAWVCLAPVAGYVRHACQDRHEVTCPGG